ncbi:MAG TPA: hypothetical protein VMH41_01745 [Mycobacteriales bacterium]|nr:hypothetical protein [Mycobacteriales bacterium]
MSEQADPGTTAAAPASGTDRAPAPDESPGRAAERPSFDGPAVSTGVAAADAARERLRDIETAPLGEHVEIFDDVQRLLHEGLTELDDED